MLVYTYAMIVNDGNGFSNNLWLLIDSNIMYHVIHINQFTHTFSIHVF